MSTHTQLIFIIIMKGKLQGQHKNSFLEQLLPGLKTGHSWPAVCVVDTALCV